MRWRSRGSRAVLAAGLLALGLIPLSPSHADAASASAPLEFEIDLRNGSGLIVRLPLSGAYQTKVRVEWDTVSPACTESIFPPSGIDFLNNLSISCTYSATDLSSDPVKTIRVWRDDPNPDITWLGGDIATTGSEKFTKVLSWGTLGITSLYGAFRGMTNLIDVPDTAPTGLVDLSSAFAGATSFNDSGISSWNTSAVTDMSGMFSGASAFNRAIGSWNTGNVTNMNGMFYDASAFNQAIGSWDVSNVVGMESMFMGATLFNQNIGTWNVSNLVNMRDMFNNTRDFNQNIGSWTTTKVIDMRGMFQDAIAFNRNLSAWNLRDLTTAVNMFRGATAFNNGCPAGPCGTAFNWPSAPALTEIGGMFAGATAFNAPVTLDTDQVTSFAEMFQDASAFNNGCANGVFTCTLSLNSDAVTTFRQMFDHASAFNQELQLTRTALATSIDGMFNTASSFNNGCASADYSCPLDFGSASPQTNFGALTNMGSAFAGAASFNQNLNTWNVTTVTHMGALFYNQGTFNNGCAAGNATCPLTWTTSSLTDMNEMFHGVTDFDQALPNFDTQYVTSMYSVFAYATNFNQDISRWSVRRVTDMRRMFFGATQFDRDLSSWCFDHPVTHTDFEFGSGFELLTAKHPSWASCPVTATAGAQPENDQVSVTRPEPGQQSETGTSQSLPETGTSTDALLFAVWMLCVGLVLLRFRKTA